ncbi:orotidine 5'-phosphate decarboxylase [Sulfolobales archaeon HS-7]|nr:orotidine 5'-phosphate decarboxylase [Sulfolobales archaeon HS-7]
MDSRIIIALDQLVDQNTLITLSQLVPKVKIGLPIILQYGKDEIKRVLSRANFSEIILDLKLADIGSTMVNVIKAVSDLGDSVIAHAFIGYENALDELKKYANEKNKKIYLLAAMSHPGWFLDIELIYNVIERTQPFGLVAPATRPSVIRKLRNSFPNNVIISPGIGYQGALPGTAICSGADYEIVGRSIYLSKEPIAMIEKINEEMVKRIEQCKASET